MLAPRNRLTTGQSIEHMLVCNSYAGTSHASDDVSVKRVLEAQRLNATVDTKGRIERGS
jgi:hypothetical protein